MIRAKSVILRRRHAVSGMELGASNLPTTPVLHILTTLGCYISCGHAVNLALYAYDPGLLENTPEQTNTPNPQSFLTIELCD